ncbi:peptide chain release factor N(5)-glutamine methyltransferase [Mucilaginibacter sp. S1162]|uniref:peptide chain release factor N(5)-glutamine methyltransferase n=1 Tax=Mucilaginibacter humi TaxID=2732510 RepID=A0ABX1W6F3_9SPHI|nr:HemK/PrmC family methyltransferase [Mucilaginibacter humi]NNU34595.1 peptide chain release factor N(5)-glutamine methyltransferase [Mucilaginibacter humi]
MKTIKNVFEIYKQRLNTIYDAPETEAITLTVLTELLNTSKGIIKAFPEKELSLTQQEEANNILNQLQTGKPLQYVLGYTEFYGLKFLVNPATLIPRPETEELVEWALSEVAVAGSVAGFNILDIGTGTGCIAISLKKNLPQAQVSAIDISAVALKTAKQNAELNEVDVNFIEANIIKSQTNSLLNTQYSILISNPPTLRLMIKSACTPM